MEKFISFIFLVGISVTSFTQIDLVQRLEFDEGYNYQFVGFGDKGGLITYLTTEKNKSATRERHFLRVDNNFKPLKKYDYSTDSKLDKYYYNSNSDQTAIINYSRKKGNYRFDVFNSSTFSVETFYGNFPKKSYVYDFQKVNDKLIAYFSTKKSRILRFFDPSNGQYRDVIPQGETKKKSYFKSYGAHGDEYHMSYEERNEDRSWTYKVYRYNSEGGLIDGRPLSLKISDEKDVYALRLLKKDFGYVISGTYSNRKSGYSEGLFTGIVDSNGEVTNIRFYNFLDLDHFTEFMSFKRQKKIEKKKAKKEKKGKELFYKGRCAVHGFFHTEDKNYLVTEFYYPTYRTETYTKWVDGKPVTQTRRVFDGYQYTHALVSSVLDNGDLEWTHIFKMNPSYKPLSVKRFIRKFEDKNKDLELSFVAGSYLHFITFSQEGEVVREKEYSVVQTKNDDDKIIYTSGSNMVHWYDNNYIVRGFQKIKDTDADRSQGEKKKRKVYFINKVAY